ncbi:MAG: M20 family metallopeptidase [Armatimonadetes bacterium]|nr:M20 family metallopeptidase [Armatimonadota bacterium]
MSDTWLVRAVAVEPWARDLRRRIHSNPELSGLERETAALVAETLAALGLSPRTGVGGHGVVCDIGGEAPGPMVALRADMDALPIHEATGLPYASQRPGVMHACGHDGHTAMLLGAASMLAAARDRLRGTVRLVFQPAEETVAGAAAMCAEGVMEGVSAVFALHGWPGIDAGVVATKSGAVMASTDTFEIAIEGRGSHGAYPHLSRDPIAIGALVVTAAQQIVARRIDPLEPAVITFGTFHAGTATNIIPAAATLTGTMRALSPAVREALPRLLEETARGVCASQGAGCSCTIRAGVDPVVNDAEWTALAVEATRSELGGEWIAELHTPSMGAEDFGVYLRHAPGAFLRLGIGNEAVGHDCKYDFNDGALVHGMACMASVAERALEAAARP